MLAADVAEFIEHADQASANALASVIETGRLTDSVSSLQLRRLGPALDSVHVRTLLDAWTRAGGANLIPPSALALALQAASASKRQSHDRAPRIEFVWTGPLGLATGLRTTYPVLHELLSSAKRSILLVGYSLNFNLDIPGSGTRLAEDMRAAAGRGVAFTFIIQDDPRNWSALREVWPSHVSAPVVLTWTQNETPGWTKLHAKVVLADDTDMLVTSANMTHHGVDRNIELGICLHSDKCHDISAHFSSLERAGILRRDDQRRYS